TGTAPCPPEHLGVRPVSSPRSIGHSARFGGWNSEGADRLPRLGLSDSACPRGCLRRLPNRRPPPWPTGATLGASSGLPRRRRCRRGAGGDSLDVLYAHRPSGVSGGG